MTRACCVGGWIADRFSNNRATLLTVSCMLTTVSPLVNAFFPNFTAICIMQIYGGIIGGIVGSCGRALQADCVPVNPATGEPFSAARDYTLMGYASFLPSLFLPTLLGVIFSSFQDQATAYKTFFLISATIHFASSFLYYVVGRKLQQGHYENREPLLRTEVYTKQQPTRPAGTRLCDSIMFYSFPRDSTLLRHSEDGSKHGIQ
eukprot:SAG31_NODE_307_length_17957_cov_5.236645_22_plen_204_part_00